MAWFSYSVLRFVLWEGGQGEGGGGLARCLRDLDIDTIAVEGGGSGLARQSL